jgi:hypothetical protein
MKYLKKFIDPLVLELKSDTKISKEEYYSIFSDDITKKNYNSLVSKITDRCNFIIRKIAEVQDIKVNWWDFDNYPSNVDDGNGHFDAKKNDKFITFDGDFDDSKIESDAVFLTDLQFPVEFIWMDDEDITKEVKSKFEKNKKELEEKKAKIKERTEALKKTKKEMIDKIKSKLTKEEIRFIKFK